MGDLGEAGGGGGADPARWAVGADKLRETGFDLGVAAAQRVVIGIGNLGCRVGVIEVVVTLDFFRQGGELGPCLVFG